MFTLAILLALGILLGHWLWRPPLWVGIALAVLVLVRYCSFLNDRGQHGVSRSYR
jgi:predicted MFS family arabinose efflux permease